MNVIIYIRHTKGSINPDIEQQRRACREYAEKRGFTILSEYIEYSANRKTKNRNTLLKILEDCGKKQFQGVLVYSYGRLTRNVSDFDTYRAALKENGVELISVTESLLMDSNALLVKRLHEAYAEYCRAEHSAKVKEGIRRAKERKAALTAATNEAD